MKEQAVHYVGLDVHQATTVASVRDERGRVVMQATVPTEARALLGLIGGLSGRVEVAFEEGTQAQWLHDLLVPHAARVVVCHVRGQGEKANKNDQLDADDVSERLRLGSLKAVWHGSPAVGTLKELVRCYDNLVDDSTRVMLRLKAIYRGRAIGTSGKSVYRPSQRAAWLAKLKTRGARTRAESLLTQLDTLTTLRHAARTAMIAEARRQPGWKILRSIPFFGPVRVAMLLAAIGTPHRFRTRRQLWPYVGLSVITRTSGEREFVDGKLVRRQRAPLTRGLNANHNRMLKNVFKGAANAAAAKAGPLKDLFDRCVAGGVRPTMAKLTLARKLAAIMLRLWKKGELWDPEKLTMQPT